MGLWFVKVVIGMVMAPVMAFMLYGTARLIALALARWMPDSPLKRKLLTDTETGKLAYRPKR